MRSVLQRRLVGPDLSRWLTGLIIMGLLAAVVFLGRQPSIGLLALPVLVLGGAALLWRPSLGLLGLVLAALLIPIQLDTGTEVMLNPAALLVPVLLAVWLVDAVRQGRITLTASRTNKPLLLFLLAGLLSLLAGNALWDPAVPRPGNMTMVQIAQWAILAFSAGAFWLAANLLPDERWLQRLTWTYLILGGVPAIMSRVPGLAPLMTPFITIAYSRAPMWALMAAVAGGQLAFNPDLSTGRRLYLVIVLGIVVSVIFGSQRDSISTWIGVLAVAGVLFWLRFPKLRIATIVLIVLLSGIVFAFLWEFWGGEARWDESGGSRLVLTERVVSVAMRNPITGLGPASYRPYAGSEPLMYLGAYWVDPQISSHNNYADLFAHVGLLGMGLLAWFFWKLGRLAHRLGSTLEPGFASGYVHGMLALLAGSLVIMIFADWILPFVYNIGFPGFQASVLVWLFWGGLVVIEQQMHQGASS